MTRPLRIEYEDACYHVMNRGRGRQCVFPSEEYYKDYLQCLSEANKRFGVEILAYCLMGNHYHLLIKTPRGNLSRAMRHIDGLYTQRYNRRKGTDGSLFRGRYKAILVDDSRYLLQVSRYIHRNPIELKKPLVNSVEEYPWSSFAAYLNLEKTPRWLNQDSVYGALKSYSKSLSYKAYVEEGNDDETVHFYQLKNTPSVLGDLSFKEKAYKQAQSLSMEVDKKGLKHPVKMMTIVAVVAAHFKVSKKEICVAKRGSGQKNVPRWIAMKLCQEVGGAKLIEIAKVFNVGHYSTVSQTIRRLNVLMNEEAGVAQIVNVLSQDLTPS